MNLLPPIGIASTIVSLSFHLKLINLWNCQHNKVDAVIDSI